MLKTFWLFILDTGFSGLHFNDMSGEETPRRVASVRKRLCLDDRDVYSGSDNKVDFNQEDNAGVSIHGMYKLLQAAYTASRFA